MANITVPALQAPTIGFQFDPARSYLEAAQVKNALAQGQANAFDLQDRQRKQDYQIELAAAPDDAARVAAMKKYDPERALQYASTLSAQARQKHADDVETVTDELGALDSVPDAQLPTATAATRAKLQADGVPTAAIDQAMQAAGGNPQTLRQLLKQQAQAGLHYKDQLAEQDKAADRKNKADTLAETIRNDKANQSLKAQEINKPVSLAQGSTLVDPRTGQPVGGGSAVGGSDASNLHGEDFLKTLPPAQATEVKALAEGRLPMPTGYSLSKLQPLIQQVGQYDPEFDAVNYNARYKARTDATSQKTAQNITALQTAIAHASQLYDQIGNVAGHSGFPGATWVNSGINALSQSAGVPGVTNYQNNTRDLADEVTRAFRQAGGSESEIKGRLAGLSENLSTEDKKDAIKGVVDRLESRIDYIKDQYERGMGTTKYPLNFIDAKTQAHIDKINGKPAAASGSGAAPTQIKSDADYNSLPSGAEFIAPDGSHRRKP